MLRLCSNQPQRLPFLAAVLLRVWQAAPGWRPLQKPAQSQLPPPPRRAARRCRCRLAAARGLQPPGREAAGPPGTSWPSCEQRPGERGCTKQVEQVSGRKLKREVACKGALKVSRLKSSTAASECCGGGAPAQRHPAQRAGGASLHCCHSSVFSFNEDQSLLIECHAPRSGAKPCKAGPSQRAEWREGGWAPEPAPLPSRFFPAKFCLSVVRLLGALISHFLARARVSS